MAKAKMPIRFTAQVLLSFALTGARNPCFSKHPFRVKNKKSVETVTVLLFCFPVPE